MNKFHIKLCYGRKVDVAIGQPLRGTKPALQSTSNSVGNSITYRLHFNHFSVLFFEKKNRFASLSSKTETYNYVHVSVSI